MLPRPDSGRPFVIRISVFGFRYSVFGIPILRLHRFPRTIGVVSQAWAGFGGGLREDLEADVGLGVDAFDHEEGSVRRLLAVTLGVAAGGEDVPAEERHLLEQFEHRGDVELEIHGEFAAVVATAHDLIAADVHADFPAFIGSGGTLEADAADFGERLEQFGEAIDESGHPLGTDVPSGLGAPEFDFADEVFDRQMGVAHGDGFRASQASGEKPSWLTRRGSGCSATSIGPAG